jgi:hypothetical protein
MNEFKIEIYLYFLQKGHRSQLPQFVTLNPEGEGDSW